MRGHGRGHRDLAELRAANVTKGTNGRIWRFLKPYRLRLSLYLAVIVASAVIGSIPPLLVRELIDKGIGTQHQHNIHLVDVLAIAMVGVALTTTALSLLTTTSNACRWRSLPGPKPARSCPASRMTCSTPRTR
jgi:ABC-type bacteriocin/lantibiotic exporter with double-glycine peptidase domain